MFPGGAVAVVGAVSRSVIHLSWFDLTRFCKDKNTTRIQLCVKYRYKKECALFQHGKATA